MTHARPIAALFVLAATLFASMAHAQGYQIRYVSQMKVFHPARATFADLQQKWDRHMAHDFTEARSRLRWGLKTFGMFVSPLAEVMRVIGSDRIRGGRNRLLALAGLTRVRLYRGVRMAQLLCGLNPKTLSDRWNRDPE